MSDAQGSLKGRTARTERAYSCPNCQRSWLRTDLYTIGEHQLQCSTLRLKKKGKNHRLTKPVAEKADGAADPKEILSVDSALGKKRKARPTRESHPLAGSGAGEDGEVPRSTALTKALVNNFFTSNKSKKKRGLAKGVLTMGDSGVGGIRKGNVTSVNEYYVPSMRFVPDTRYVVSYRHTPIVKKLFGSRHGRTKAISSHPKSFALQPRALCEAFGGGKGWSSLRKPAPRDASFSPLTSPSPPSSSPSSFCDAQSSSSSSSPLTDSSSISQPDSPDFGTGGAGAKRRLMHNSEATCNLRLPAHGRDVGAFLDSDEVRVFLDHVSDGVTPREDIVAMLGFVVRRKLAGKSEGALWTEAYTASTADEVWGKNREQMERMCEWLGSWKRDHQSNASVGRESKSSWDDDDDDNDGYATEEDDEEGEVSIEALLLVGDVGVGKTASVFAAAASCGFHVMEINAGMERGAAKVKRICTEATQSHRISMDTKGLFTSKGRPKSLEEKLSGFDLGVFSVEELMGAGAGANKGSEKSREGRKKEKEQEAELDAEVVVVEEEEGPAHPAVKGKTDTLILFEEVDNLECTDDLPTLQVIRDLIQTAKRPVVLTCNQYHLPDTLRNLRKLGVELIKFDDHDPAVPDARIYLLLFIALVESNFNAQVDVAQMRCVLDACHGDVRRSIAAVQYQLGCLDHQSRVSGGYGGQSRLLGDIIGLMPPRKIQSFFFDSDEAYRAPQALFSWLNASRDANPALHRELLFGNCLKGSSFALGLPALEVLQECFKLQPRAEASSSSISSSSSSPGLPVNAQVTVDVLEAMAAMSDSLSAMDVLSMRHAPGAISVPEFHAHKTHMAAKDSVCFRHHSDAVQRETQLHSGGMVEFSRTPSQPYRWHLACGCEQTGDWPDNQVVSDMADAVAALALRDAMDTHRHLAGCVVALSAEVTVESSISPSRLVDALESKEPSGQESAEVEDDDDEDEDDIMLTRKRRKNRKGDKESNKRRKTVVDLQEEEEVQKKDALEVAATEVKESILCSDELDLSCVGCQVRNPATHDWFLNDALGVMAVHGEQAAYCEGMPYVQLIAHFDEVRQRNFTASLICDDADEVLATTYGMRRSSRPRRSVRGGMSQPILARHLETAREEDMTFLLKHALQASL